MKKVLLTVAAAVAMFSANAQITNDRGTFTKPAAGEFAFETQISPNIVGGGIFNLNDPFLQNLSGGISYGTIAANTGTANSFAQVNPSFPMLKGRYFLSDGLALRAQLGVVTSSRTIDNDGNKDRIAKNGFALALGLEKHFTGAERLSTYAGADILFGVANGNAKVATPAAEYKSSQTGIGFGLRVVSGFDYYFIPKVYLGAELGLGLGVNSYGVVKAEGGGLTDGKVKSRSFQVDPFITPAIRLGYRF